MFVYQKTEKCESKISGSIAINDSYKQKGSNEVKKITTYANCSYWLGDAIASHLTKGTLVELYGRIGVNAWNNLEGEAKATLNFHVNNIKLHGKTKSEHQTVSGKESAFNCYNLIEKIIILLIYT